MKKLILFCTILSLISAPTFATAPRDGHYLSLQKIPNSAMFSVARCNLVYQNAPEDCRLLGELTALDIIELRKSVLAEVSSQNWKTVAYVVGGVVVGFAVGFVGGAAVAYFGVKAGWIAVSGVVYGGIVPSEILTGVIVGTPTGTVLGAYGAEALTGYIYSNHAALNLISQSFQNLLLHEERMIVNDSHAGLNFVEELLAKRLPPGTLLAPLN